MRHLVDAVFARVPGAAPAACTGEAQKPRVLKELSREDIIDWRARACRDRQAIFEHIDQYGEFAARRLFTSAFVDQAQRHARISRRTRLGPV
ncbi:hypothetical protein [Streptomyces angustmyceticus]|uniref:hypothetical protein n=1 Tax=Streptomyces angustmyceticus TaxID=285578 RepID=UPI003D93B3A2